MPSCTIRSAMGPCPCPSDIDDTMSETPRLSAKSLMTAIGSAPAESTKMRGVVQFDSSKDA